MYYTTICAIIFTIITASKSSDDRLIYLPLSQNHHQTDVHKDQITEGNIYDDHKKYDQEHVQHELCNCDQSEGGNFKYDPMSRYFSGAATDFVDSAAMASRNNWIKYDRDGQDDRMKTHHYEKLIDHRLDDEFDNVHEENHGLHPHSSGRERQELANTPNHDGYRLREHNTKQETPIIKQYYYPNGYHHLINKNKHENENFDDVHQ